MRDPSISSRVILVIDYYGPSDFDFIGSTEIDSYWGVVVFLEARAYSANPELWHEASPASCVTSHDPAFFIAHGTQGSFVDPTVSYHFESDLKTAGSETCPVMVGGLGMLFNLKKRSRFVVCSSRP